MPKQMQAVKATTWHNKKPNATKIVLAKLHEKEFLKNW